MKATTQDQKRTESLLQHKGVRLHDIQSFSFMKRFREVPRKSNLKVKDKYGAGILTLHLKQGSQKAFYVRPFQKPSSIIRYLVSQNIPFDNSISRERTAAEIPATTYQRPSLYMFYFLVLFITFMILGYPPVVSSICCRRAYIRGAFISVGSVNDPEKNYHLEFVLADLSAAEQLRDLINAFGLDAKVVERKEHYIVYLKEGEQIVDLLNIMEAPLALMDLENVRIVKEMRNDINRKVNCETANLNKVVGAAVKQLEDINYIEETIGLARLPEQLAEVARVRLEYPDRSLKELGSFLMTPVGKSGVNHRLRKISSIAEALREGKGGIE